jgi:hypothetical protein
MEHHYTRYCWYNYCVYTGLQLQQTNNLHITDGSYVFIDYSDYFKINLTMLWVDQFRRRLGILNIGGENSFMFWGNL